MKKIAIFASGSGSNAAKIIEYFEDNSEVEVSLVVSNRKSAGVLEIARNKNVAYLVIDRDYFYKSQEILKILENCDFIVLAGFLWLIPDYLITTFPQRIINIHPALLPLYGGIGMYGMHVHQAVKQHKDVISGMTIHFVNARYDEGEHIFQAQCVIDPNDTPEEIAEKVLHLEHTYYAPVIEGLVNPL